MQAGNSAIQDSYRLHILEFIVHHDVLILEPMESVIL